MSKPDSSFFGHSLHIDQRSLQRLSIVFTGLIGLSLFLLVFFTIAGIRTLDDIDQKQDIEVVESLLTDRKNIMARMLHDYAEWTDAYRNMYEKENQKFADENIAYNLTNNYSIVISSVVRFDGSVWVYFKEGKKVSAPSLHPDITRLVQLLMQDFKDNDGKPSKNDRIGFAEIDGQLMMIGVNLIAALDDKTGKVLPLPKNPSMLVLVKKLNDQTLKEWADVYNIRDVHYTPKALIAAPQPPDSQDSIRFFITVHDVDNRDLGEINWQADLNSTLISKTLLPNLLIVFTLVLGLGLIFFVYMRRAFYDQLRFAQQIDDSRKFLQQVFDTDPTHIQVRDKEGRVFFSNRAAAARYELRPEQLLNKSFLQIDPDPERAQSMYQDDLKTIIGQRESEMEEIWEDGRGQQKIFYTLRKPMQAADDTTMVLAVSSDITHQKKAVRDMELAKQKAEDASRAKTEFLSTISHEIRTPMNGILGFSQLLSDTQLSPEQDEYIKIIQNSSKSLLSIINDILDMSRIEAGRLKLQNEILNPAQVVDSVVKTLLPLSKEKNLSLVTEVYGGIPQFLSGDASRLGQILMNLINNALKFTSEGGVTVRIQVVESNKDDTVLKFDVLDTGAGIAQESMDKLFKKFSQIDSSSARRYGGSGLGLAIAKELVEMMGGEIGVQSQLGKGSHFWFTARLQNTF